MTAALRGNWMQTFTGRRFWPMSPLPEDVDPKDIAHSLSLICRYGGHTVRFYSVAEHCVLLSRAVSSQAALPALLHDAAEAYGGDMIRPLKHHAEMAPYRCVMERIELAVFERFGIAPLPCWPEVGKADFRILWDERRLLMSPTDNDWTMGDTAPLGVAPEGWPPKYAEQRYLTRLQELTS